MNSIHALLEKRASKYSDRPKFTVAGELMELEKVCIRVVLLTLITFPKLIPILQATALLQYGEELRIHRKLQHSALGPSAIRQYQPIQEDLVALRKAATDLRSTPDGDLKKDSVKHEYEQACQAAKRTLQQTYVDRFDSEKFDNAIKDPTKAQQQQTGGPRLASHPR